MFTGLVREVGTVAAVERTQAGARIRIQAALAGELEPGASISVAGACLTTAERDGSEFAADIMNQTLALTTLGELQPGDSVNLEPALRAGDALGGHIVQGHVDGTAVVATVTEDGLARRLRIALAPEHLPLVVEHGSITVDGVSLTVAALADDGAEVSLIPETLDRTTLGDLRAGEHVNVELDVIARHVARLLQFTRKGAPGA